MPVAMSMPNLTRALEFHRLLVDDLAAERVDGKYSMEMA